MKQINELINNGYSKKALEIINKALTNSSEKLNLYYLKAKAEFSLNYFNDCIESTSKILLYNNKDFGVYNLRALSHFNIGNIEKSIEDFRRAIDINPEFDQPYNFIGASMFNLGRVKESIEYFIKCLKFNKNNNQAKSNLINALTMHEAVGENIYVKLNNEIRRLNNSLDFNQDLEGEIAKFYNNSNAIIKKNFGLIEYDATQLYRRSSRYLNCSRHKKIFNKFKAIPKFCFDCFKIQISVKNVIDLIRLHVFFNQYNFKQNLTRKCMIELRPNINDMYKGLIYCESLKQADSIKEELKNKINFNANIQIKKGCTEFGNLYPGFKKLNSKYSDLEKDWSTIEENFDKNNPNLNIFKNSNVSLTGFFLQDILVFRNWLYFAQKIHDKTYKKISDDIFKSNFIDSKLE